MKKNIACLILVHKNISQLLRLCDCLRHDDVKIFIHLDKKMKVSRNEIRMLDEYSENVHVVPERFSCFLDEWSLIEATMALINCAKSTLNGSIGYYVLMSGQDYLIKPVTELVDFLHKNYPRPFIDCTPRSGYNWVSEKFAHTRLRIFARKLRHIVGVRGFLLFSLYLERLMPERCILFNKLKRFNINLYGGSAWWALPDIVVDDIIAFLKNNPEFVKLYKWTDTPEETLFQTLTMLSRCASLVQLNSPEERMQNCLTYANFETPTKEFTGHPHIITIEDYDWLVGKEQFIARKFDMAVDCDVIDKLDKCILDR